MDVLVLCHFVDGVVQAEAHKEQGHAAAYADDGHDKALFIAGQVAQGSLAGKVQPAPEEGDPLQKDPAAALWRLGPHQLCGLGPELAQAGKEGGAAGAQGGGPQSQKGLVPVDGGKDIEHARIHDPVGLNDQPGQEPFPEGRADDPSRQGGQHGVEKISARYGPVGIAQGLEGADLDPLLVHHAGHGRQADQGGHQEKDDREDMAQRGHAVRVLIIAHNAFRKVPVQDVPFRHLQLFQLLFPVGDLYLGILDLFYGVGIGLVILRLGVLQLLPGILQFLFSVGELLLALFQLLFGVQDILPSVVDLLLSLVCLVQVLLQGLSALLQGRLAGGDLLFGAIQLFPASLQLLFSRGQKGKGPVQLVLYGRELRSAFIQGLLCLIQHFL